MGPSLRRHGTAAALSASGEAAPVQNRGLDAQRHFLPQEAPGVARRAPGCAPTRAFLNHLEVQNAISPGRACASAQIESSRVGDVRDLLT